MYVYAYIYKIYSLQHINAKQGTWFTNFPIAHSSILLYPYYFLSYIVLFSTSLLPNFFFIYWALFFLFPYNIFYISCLLFMPFLSLPLYILHFSFTVILVQSFLLIFKCLPFLVTFSLFLVTSRTHLCFFISIQLS